MHGTGHILCLHHTERERFRVVADWFLAGAADEAKLLYVDADYGQDVVVPGLEAQGFAAARALQTGRLELITSDDVSGVGSLDAILERFVRDDEFSGVRLSVRPAAVTRHMDLPDHEALEDSFRRLARERRLSTLCQYDARTTHGADLGDALRRHPDWVFEADLSVRRLGHVVTVGGSADSFDGEVLERSLRRMAADMATDQPLVLDMRHGTALTLGAAHALVSGTQAFRDRGGSVLCGVGTDTSEALQTVVAVRAPVDFLIV